MSASKLVLALFALSVGLLPAVNAHAVIQAVNGDNGVVTTGFGVLATTPRTGTDEQNFQVDTSVLKNLVDDPCGATLSGGSVNIATNMAAMEAAGSGSLPSLAATGAITVSLHQVNADGGGPFFAMVNADGTGATWETAEVTLQPPGVNGLLIAGPNDADLTAVVPSNVTCTGGTAGNACIIRLSNGGPGSVANGAGPFGGCFAVQQGSSTAAAAGTAATTAAAGTAATTAATTTTGNTKNNKGNNKGNNNKFQNRAGESAAQNIRRALLADLSEHLAKRLTLSFSDIEDLKTATGTAIDIPIDALAGQDDNTANGGNSTTAAGATLTIQQAVDLKKAVQLAIESALDVLGNSDASLITADGTFSAADTEAANKAARVSTADGSLQTVNAGNAGVGSPNLAVVSSLLGALATVDVAAGGAAAATATAAAAAGTTAATGNAATGNAAGNNGKGGNRNGRKGKNGREIIAERRYERLMRETSQ